MARLVHYFPLLLLLLWWVALRLRPGGRRSRTLLGLLALLTALAWPPVVRVSFLLLEARYPDAPELRGAQAIVVLSGSMRQPDEFHPSARLGPGTYARTRAAAELALAELDVPVVVSGGRVQAGAEVALATAMRDQLVSEGVPTERVWLEDRSTTTWENAVHSARLLKDHGIHRIVLVTEAYHMPRSVACFEAQGLDVIAAPCEFRSRGHDLRWSDALPTPRSLVEHERLFHELVGSLYYRLQGRF